MNHLERERGTHLFAVAFFLSSTSDTYEPTKPQGICNSYEAHIIA